MLTAVPVFELALVLAVGFHFSNLYEEIKRRWSVSMSKIARCCHLLCTYLMNSRKWQKMAINEVTEYQIGGAHGKEPDTTHTSK